MLIPLETLIQKYNFKLNRVLHLGAHLGEESANYDSNSAKEVVWVEANPKLMGDLKNNLNKYPNQRAFNLLVSEKEGAKHEFHITNNGASSSMLELGTHTLRHPNVVEVDQLNLIGSRLDRLIEKESLQIDEFNLLNIDLQGAELIALRSLGQYLKHFQYIYLEINVNYLYKSCPLLHELDRFLFRQGFIRKETALVKEGWGDALYVKENASKKTYFKNVFQALNYEKNQILHDRYRQLKTFVKKQLKKVIK